VQEQREEKKTRLSQMQTTDRSSFYMADISVDNYPGMTSTRSSLGSFMNGFMSTKDDLIRTLGVSYGGVSCHATHSQPITVDQ
jgi:hypothetical protein